MIKIIMYILCVISINVYANTSVRIADGVTLRSQLDHLYSHSTKALDGNIDDIRNFYIPNDEIGLIRQKIRFNSDNTVYDNKGILRATAKKLDKPVLITVYVKKSDEYNKEFSRISEDRAENVCEYIRKFNDKNKDITCKGGGIGKFISNRPWSKFNEYVEFKHDIKNNGI
jgi:hypothetical protein